jgi:hypothetical protein
LLGVSKTSSLDDGLSPHVSAVIPTANVRPKNNCFRDAVVHREIIQFADFVSSLTFASLPVWGDTLSEHQYHGRGTAIDVNNLLAYARDRFLQICLDMGATFTAGEPNATSAHCEWADNISRFPTSACPLSPAGSPPPGVR